MIDIDLGSSPITSLAFSENGYYLASGDSEGTVNLWDLRNLSCIHTLNLESKSTVTSLNFDNR